jgi:hypothetical protein
MTFSQLRSDSLSLPPLKRGERTSTSTHNRPLPMPERKWVATLGGNTWEFITSTPQSGSLPLLSFFPFHPPPPPFSPLLIHLTNYFFLIDSPPNYQSLARQHVENPGSVGRGRG